MTWRKTLSHMFILTASGIIAKTVDFSFRAYYSSRLGEGGMGIFSLVMSVFGIILSLSSAGMGAAVSRLVAMKAKSDGLREAQGVVKTAVKAVLILGLISTASVMLLSDKIALFYLKDIRCTKGLICIAPASIFMGISYCIKGYFYAIRQTVIPASSEFVEQAVKISVISFLLGKWLPMGTEQGVAAVFLGLTIGEFCSCLYLCLWYKRGILEKAEKSSYLTAILGQTLPVAASSVCGSYLRMQEDIYIIRGFEKYGMGKEASLEAYGLIHGMAMPLLVFPLTLLSSFMALLVPEISRAKEGGRLRQTTALVYKTAFLFGGGISLIFFIFAEEISMGVYGSVSAARYIRPLSLLCPIMLIDSVSVGMLEGLGKQTKLFKYNLIDCLFRLGMVYFFLPVWGSKIIILMIFLSNILTCSLTFGSINKLVRIR